MVTCRNWHMLALFMLMKMWCQWYISQTRLICKDLRWFEDVTKVCGSEKNIILFDGSKEVKFSQQFIFFVKSLYETFFCMQLALGGSSSHEKCTYNRPGWQSRWYPLEKILEESITKVHLNDLVHRDWCVHRKEMDIWVDTILKGTNLVHQWQATILHLMTNCVCSSYLWVRWTIELLRRVSDSRLKTSVKCGECQSVDPTLVYWQRGKITSTWHRTLSTR